MGMIVYDTIESDHPVQTAVKETVEFGASVAGGIAGEMIGTAATVSLFAATGIATTTVVASVAVLAASIITGVVLAVAVGALTGYLISKFFESGGETSKAPKTPTTTTTTTLPSLKKCVIRHPTTEHLVIHVAKMPDAERLARRLTAGARVGVYTVPDQTTEADHTDKTTTAHHQSLEKAFGGARDPIIYRYKSPY